MKAIRVFFYVSICLFFFQITFGIEKIDSIKIIPSLPSNSDSVYFKSYTQPFSGDCSYDLNIDSINDDKIYISGKFDSNENCLTGYADDSIFIGIFFPGNYTVVYSLIDTSKLVQTSVYTIDFTVSKPTRKMDSIKIIPSLPTIDDPIYFRTYSQPFSGDCLYGLSIDSLNSNTIYISGKYDSNCKCLTGGANDSINLGLFSLGSYTIIYSLIDTNDYFQTSESTLNFTVNKAILEMDSIEILPSLPNIDDYVYFRTYSQPFSGDCSYGLNIDSLNDKMIYISGKFDSNEECVTEGANDSINLGLFSAGTYTVVFSLIDSNDYFQKSESTIDFTVSETTSLNSIDYKNKIYVYPNPCNKYLNISLLSNISENTYIQIFNSLGQLEYESHHLISDSELIIDMSNYKNGIYFLRIDNDEIFNIKIIKE